MFDHIESAVGVMFMVEGVLSVIERMVGLPGNLAILVEWYRVVGAQSDALAIFVVVLVFLGSAAILFGPRLWLHLRQRQLLIPIVFSVFGGIPEGGRDERLVTLPPLTKDIFECRDLDLRDMLMLDLTRYLEDQDIPYPVDITDDRLPDQREFLKNLYARVTCPQSLYQSL